MLQIRLNKPQNEGGGAKSDTVTVACPDHLVLADLPVAKSLGSASASAPLKIVGRRSRRQLGERVHFCVQCDLPIAVYGRLSPCEHAFCLDCARTDSLCFLCEERIQKIQTIKMMEGLLICAAPGCLKSFLKKSDLESHIRGLHMDLIHQDAENDGNESEAVSARKPTASESTVQGRPLISQGSNLQAQDRGEAHRLQPRDQPPPRNFIQPKPMSSLPGQSPSHFSDQQLDNNPPPGFDRPGPPNRYGQQTFDHQGGVRQDSSKQTGGGGGGGVSESGFPEYPTMQVHQQPPINFAMLPAIPPTQVMSAPPPQFGYTLVTEGGQQFYGGGAPPYEMGRPELNQEQGSVLGFPPGPSGAMNIAEGGYPRPWSMGPAVAGGTFEPSSQGGNAVDSQGRGVIFQGGGGGPASNMVLPPASSKGSESSSIQGGTAMEFRGGGNGILAQQSHSLPPPPPPPSFPQHLSHHVNQGNFYSNEVNNDGQTFGWSNEKRDG